MNPLKDKRFFAGLTQDELQRKTGIHQTRISRLERGYLKPTAEEKQKLAKALKVTQGKLFPKN